MKKQLTNEQKAKRTEYQKQYREANREKLLENKKLDYLKNKKLRNEQSKNWREANTNKIKELKAAYYQKNKDKISEREKLYREQNKELILERKKDYYNVNKEDILKQVKIYQKTNKEQIKEYQKQYHINNRSKRNETEKNRYNTDELYRLKKNIRNAIYRTLKNKGVKKNDTTLNILGCSYDEFKIYVESKFESWMCWENQGNPKDKVLELNKSWDIDHITPIDTAMTESDVIRLNHFTNLQPLCSYYNRHIKTNKVAN